jgi:hypothetical protein
MPLSVSSKQPRDDKRRGARTHARPTWLNVHESTDNSGSNKEHLGAHRRRTTLTLAGRPRCVTRNTEGRGECNGFNVHLSDYAYQVCS